MSRLAYSGLPISVLKNLACILTTVPVVVYNSFVVLFSEALAEDLLEVSESA
jgi:hypothetical protein